MVTTRPVPPKNVIQKSLIAIRGRSAGSKSRLAPVTKECRGTADAAKRLFRRKASRLAHPYIKTHKPAGRCLAVTPPLEDTCDVGDPESEWIPVSLARQEAWASPAVQEYHDPDPDAAGQRGNTPRCILSATGPDDPDSAQSHDRAVHVAACR